MRKFTRVVFVVLLAPAILSLSIGSNASAQAEKPPATSSAAPHDLEGVWFKPAPKDLAPKLDKFGDTIQPPPPPMTPYAQALYDVREKAREAGNPIPDPMVKCAPVGLPRLMARPYPFQVIQTPGQITVVHEGAHTTWIIHMDRQTHPANLKPSWMGDTIGHWEGDTLVTETVGQRSDNLTFENSPITPATRVVQRIRKIDGGRKLEDVYTIEDPKLYTKVWGARVEYLWVPEETVMEYVCEESGRVEDAAAASFH
jgi:hypothetical protein